MTSSMFLVNRQAFDRRRDVLDEKIIKKQIQEKGFLQSVIEATEFCCLNTTLHGLRNIYESVVEYGRCKSRAQRCLIIMSIVMWVTFLCLGIGFATVLINYFWQRFQTTPTITTIETNLYPIWNVEFPAVTICNINKVYRPATLNLTQELSSRGVSKNEIEFFLGNLSKLVRPEDVNNMFERTHNILEQLNYESDTLMRELMHPCDNQLSQCLWLGKSVPCNTLFRTAKSIEGYCCSFNYNAIKEDLEIDSEKISDELQNPNFRVSGAGPYVGIEVLVNIEPQEYMSYTRTYYGVIVMVHSPNEYPQNAVARTIGQVGTDVTINVVPSVVVSEPSIKDLSLPQRNCYFKDEVKLRTAPSYSFSTCTNECAVDTIYNTCNCIPFFYVEAQIISNGTTKRLCTLQDTNCLRKHRHIFASLQPESLLNETIGLKCPKCKPSCSEVRYDIQTSIAHRLSEAQLRSLHFEDSVKLNDFVTLKIHFKDITCLKYRGDIFLTWDSMFASCGGIYSLCLGGSVISIIELVWFYTVKLYRFSKEPSKVNKTQMQNDRRKQVSLFKSSSKRVYNVMAMKRKVRPVDGLPNVISG